MNKQEAENLLNLEFNVCGCSEIELIIQEIIKFLTWAESDISTRESFETIYENRNGIFYIVAGILDKIEIIEHGTSIRCCWITEKGKEFLENLKRIV